MDWQMVGAVAELLGAAGVIATLGYLASQIRHGRVAAQQAAVAEVLDQNAGLLAQLSSSPDMARLWRLGMAADEELSADEVLQFRIILMQMAYLWERIYHFTLSGHVDDWVVASNRVTRRELVGAPGFRSWFEGRKHWMSPEFRAVLERDIEASSDHQPLGDLTTSSSRRGLERGTA